MLSIPLFGEARGAVVLPRFYLKFCGLVAPINRWAAMSCAAL